MSSLPAFSLGFALTAALGFTVVAYLKSHLKGILVDLCGNERRAGFWMAFSNIVLILVPMIFSMQFHLEADDRVAIVWQLTYQLKWVFIGLAASLMCLAAILGLFIRGNSRVNGQ